MTDELKAAIAAWLDADLRERKLNDEVSRLNREINKTMSDLRLVRDGKHLAVKPIAEAVGYHHGDAARVVSIGNGNGMLLRHSCNGPEIVMVRIEELQPEGGA